MAVFDRGDIVGVHLDAVPGNAAGGSLAALVLTTKDFNKLGNVLLAPITQAEDVARFAGFAVALAGTGCKTKGVVLVNKVRTMDLATMRARKIERAAQGVVDEALERLAALLS